MKIDNFALTMFQTCPAKYFLRMHEGWTSKRKSGALGFGGALHEGLATWYKTHDKGQSLIAIDEAWPLNLPIDDWRTKEKCLTVMVEYMKHYPIESFKIIGAPESPMIENTFTIASGMFLDCEQCGPPAGSAQDAKTMFVSGRCSNCGLPLEEIEYGGIFDGGVEFSGNDFVLEHKTTSQLGTYYFNQFKPNNQITGYIWALRQLTGKRIGGAIVNAIGLYKSSTTKFERSITTRSDEDIADWLENVRATCQMIKDCERRAFWPKHTQSCTMYGKCEYHDVHTLGAKQEQEKFLEQMFVKEPWSYEHRDEVKEGASA
jgi:hypothetical protein